MRSTVGIAAMDEYVTGVLDKRIVVGELARLAVERHVRDLDRGRERGLYFDAERAGRAIQFCGYLNQSKGEWAGKPLVLQSWQAFVIGSVKGWQREDGTRRFREAYNEIARKNGKTTTAAGLGLETFLADGEFGAEIYSAATKRDQAKLVWDEARAMIRFTPELKSVARLLRDRIEVESTRSKFEPLAAEEDSLDGLNVHLAILDEVHAWKGRGVYDVIATATGARRQPLIFSITTAGWDRSSVCWTLRSHAEQVLRGTLEDDTFFAYCAGIDPTDDWSDPDCWVKANPNLGVSVKLDDLKRKADRAKAQPAEQNAFRRLHCNEWTEQAERWIDMSAWDQGAEPIDWRDYEDRPCYAGLDLSATTDLSAFAQVWPEDDGSYAVRVHAFLPGENLRERELRDKVPYGAWADMGLLTLTEGSVIDYDEIRRHINEAHERAPIVELAIDRLFNATQISKELLEDGITVVANDQSWRNLAAPTREFGRLVAGGLWRHGGNPLFRWCAGNCAVRLDDNGNPRVSKAKSTGRIDPIVASIMALGGAMARGGGASVYETRGVLVL